jgi:transcriptional regulator GlxA family with amidase domain
MNDPPTDPRVRRAMRILDGSPASGPCLADLARSVDLSASRLWHMFRAQAGVSPAAYIRRARLQRAAELLALSKRSVKEIAFAVGFRSASHFVRAFRRAYGMPPYQYRAELNKS